MCSVLSSSLQTSAVLPAGVRGQAWEGRRRHTGAIVTVRLQLTVGPAAVTR